MKDGMNLNSNYVWKSDKIRMMKLLILIAVIISIILLNLISIENQLFRFDVKVLQKIIINKKQSVLLESIVVTMNYNRY